MAQDTNTPHTHKHPTKGAGLALARGAFAFDITGAENAPALGRIQLFPYGSFTARDGRPANMQGVSAPAWQCTKREATNIIAQWQGRATPLVVDYEHQTQHADNNGKPAPAAGWIVELDWQEGTGLFATVEWTARARAYIRAKEYRYISPVFSFDTQSGAVITLVCAALTNNPALDGLAVVTAKDGLADLKLDDKARPADFAPPSAASRWAESHEIRSFTAEINPAYSRIIGAAYCVNSPTDGLTVLTANPQGDSPMDKTLLAFLQKVLGLPPSSTEAQCTAAATAALVSLPENVLAALVAKDAEITSLKSKTESTPDPAQFVPMAVANTLREQVTSLSTKVTTLEQEKAGKAMQADIDAALKDGRLPATGAAWATALATTNPEALRDFLQVAPPVAALNSHQSAALHSQDVVSAALTAEDNYVCKQLGMSHEDFTKHKEQK